MAARRTVRAATLLGVAALLAVGPGAPTPPAAARTTAPYVKLKLIANGGGDRLDVLVRVTTARPKISCRGIARQLDRSRRLPRLRTGAEGGAQWHWYVGDGAPRAKLRIRVTCSFPDHKFRRARTTQTVGPGPFQRRVFRHLIQPRSLKKERWVPDKTANGSGGGADLYPPGQCTWYVATRRRDLPYFPGRTGDAENWIESAQRFNFPTGTKPRVGAVAVFRPGQYEAGYYGHVAYVTEVDDKTITVAEANYHHHAVGSKRTLPWRGLRFIYEVGDDVPPPPASEPPPSLPQVATLLVSGATGSAGEASNNESSGPAISADGRFLAFESTASNLDPADHDTTKDVFVRDLRLGTTTLVSRPTGTSGKGNDESSGPAISADGRHVAFESYASNLDTDDGDGARDVFVRDVLLETTTLVSRPSGTSGKGNSRSQNPDISGSGERVAFESYASNLDTDDGDATPDVFVRDVRLGTTTLVSRANGRSGAKGNLQSFNPAISGDGWHVAFISQASNLDPAAASSGNDVFVRDLQNNATTLVSRGNERGNGASANPDISADGGFVAFESYSTNLDAADGDATLDVFARNVRLGTTTLISRPSGTSGKGNSASFTPAISGDGSRVTFVSSASNLDPDDGDTVADVFVRDVVAATTTLITRATGSFGAKGNGESSAPAISADWRYATFVSQASNLDPADGDGAPDVFVRDLQTTTMTLASRATGNAGTKDRSVDPTVSSDGRYVAFVSFASKLDPDDVDTVADVFVRDVQAGTTTLVSRATGLSGVKGDKDSSSPAVSADGRFVAFVSQARLDPDDHDDQLDVFVRDVQAGTTTFVSRATGTAGSWGGYPSSSPAISGDGRYVTFVSAGGDLDPDDHDAILDVFVRDVQEARTTLVSRGPSGKGNGDSSSPAISGDGRYVAFASQASNLDPADGDATVDVFVRDVQAGATTLVSRAAGGSGAKGNAASSSPDVSGDGRYVAFASEASNLDPADGDATVDVFVRDVQAGVTTLVSRAAGGSGAKGNNASDSPAISGDGREVTFVSSASNLDPADGDATLDVFVRDVQISATALVSRAAGGSGAKGNGASASPDVSGVGRYVAFASQASNLAPADGDTVSDVFLRDVLGESGSLPAPPLSPSSPGGGRTAPNAKLSGSRTQKLGATVVVRIFCEEACRATTTGSVRVPRVGSAHAKTYKTNAVTTPIRKGRKATVKVKLSPSARIAIRRALRAGRRIVVKVSVRVADAAGNAQTLTRPVKLKLKR